MKQLVAISILVVFVLLWPSAAVACEQCLGIGGSNGPTIRALIFSMAALLSMVSFVGVGIGMFFVRTYHRSKQLAAGNMEVNARGHLAPRTTV